MCCGAFSLDDVDYCNICPHCGWEDWYECHDAPGEVIRPNRVSLHEARQIVAKYGATACAHVNCAGGLSIADLERMTSVEVSALKSKYV
ncbi:MAG: hypothetical protein KIS87_09320 [Phycisphaeraceae bacterium]|nr:hypothetical protein [Phycisphaeraceae bacterium]